MKSYKKLSMLTVMLPFLGGVVSLPVYADDAMMKKDDVSTAMQNDAPTMKNNGMNKDSMMKGSDHMQKNDSMAMKPDAMSKDDKDKMAPDTAMINK